MSSKNEPSSTGGTTSSLVAVAMLNQPIVIDCGSASMKTGFVGGTKPKVSVQMLLMGMHSFKHNVSNSFHLIDHFKGGNWNQSRLRQTPLSCARQCPLPSREKINKPESPIHDVLLTSILQSDMDLRSTLFSNIVLSEGLTLLPRLGDWLLYEVRAQAPERMRIPILAPPERKESAWVGGSILASLATFKNMWVGRTTCYSLLAENSMGIHVATQNRHL
jgi:actin-related protein